MNEILSKKVFYANTIEDIGWFVLIFLFGLVLQQIISRLLAQLVFRVLKKYSSGLSFEKLFELVRKPLCWFVIFCSTYFAFEKLTFPSEWNFTAPPDMGVRLIAYKLLYISIAISFTWILLRIVDFFGLILMQRALKTESKSDDQLVPFFRESIKIVVFVLSCFFILGSIFNLNVASLIAGLGIGGIAIALAAKESLENLFASFTIFLDKPFHVGDLVQIGNVQGNVERIGFRSTRIRTLEKSVVTVPNKKMVDAELDNLTMRTHRRVKMIVNLTYNTSGAQVKNIIGELQAFFEYHEFVDTGLSRVALMDLGQYAINILVDYYIIGNDPDKFLTIREEVNFKIIDVVEKNGSSLAYPTQTILQK